MDSSEKLIELGNSWYTAKTIEVERQLISNRHINMIRLKCTPKVQHWKKSLYRRILNWKYRTKRKQVKTLRMAHKAPEVKSLILKSRDERKLIK